MNPRVAFRLAHGWTQQQAADAWNEQWPDDPKALKAISRWEVWPAPSGHAPPFDVLNRLAQLYHCTVADLLTDQADYRHLDTAHLNAADGPGRRVSSVSPQFPVPSPQLRELTAAKTTSADVLQGDGWDQVLPPGGESDTGQFVMACPAAGTSAALTSA